MKQLTIFLCLFLASCCFCEKLPSSFQKCSRYQSDFNQCLRTAAEGAIRQLNRRIGNIGWNSLEPVEVPLITVDARTSSIQLEANYENVKFYGFTNIKVLNLSMNFDTNTLFMDSFFPEIRWDLDYAFNGTVLSRSLTGKGRGSIIQRNVRFLLTFQLNEYEKKDEKYFEVVGVKCVMDFDFLRVNFVNLIEGTKLINDNWRMLSGEVRSVYEAAFGQIFTAVFNGLLVEVPIRELFGTN